MIQKLELTGHSGDIKKEELITSPKDANWPQLKELKNSKLFKNL